MKESPPTTRTISRGWCCGFVAIGSSTRKPGPSVSGFCFLYLSSPDRVSGLGRGRPGFAERGGQGGAVSTPGPS